MSERFLEIWVLSSSGEVGYRPSIGLFTDCEQAKNYLAERIPDLQWRYEKFLNEWTFLGGQDVVWHLKSVLISPLSFTLSGGIPLPVAELAIAALQGDPVAIDAIQDAITR